MQVIRQAVFLAIGMLLVASQSHADTGPSFGRWETFSTTDEMTDVTTFIAMNKTHLGEQPVAGIASLIVGCHKPSESAGSKEIFALQPTVLSYGQWKKVFYRIDKNSVVTPNVSNGDGSGMVFFGIDPSEFANAQKIVIRVYDYHGQDFTFNFDASRTSDALAYIHGRCRS